MEDGLSDLIKSIERETREGYSPAVIDHAMNPRNVGALENADGEARFKGPCGDTMVVWIEVSGGKIRRANFWTDGCGTAIACGSMVTELSRDKTPGEAVGIGQPEVLEALGGLPPETEHCALLAATTLKMAMKDYREREGTSR